MGVKSVTLDGDVYDPSGTLSGGSVPNSSGILVKVQELQEAERRVRKAEERLRGMEADMTRSKGKREVWKKLEHELEIKMHEMSLLEGQINGSSAARVSPPFFSTLSFISPLFSPSLTEIEFG